MQNGIEVCGEDGGRNAVTKKPRHSQSCEEAIRDFHVPDDQIPCTFRLLRVQGLPPWANTSCVSIGDVIQVVKMIVMLLLLAKVLDCDRGCVYVAIVDTDQNRKQLLLMWLQLRSQKP